MKRGSKEYVLKDLEAAATDVIKRLTLDITADLQETNPVATGWSAANWIPNIGGSFSKAPVGQRIMGNIDVATQQTQIAKVATQYKLGPPVHITNNVPYITILNESHRTAAGFVDRAVEKNVKKYKGKKLK